MGRAYFTVDALLDAARDVVLAHGLRGTTIAAIARRAGAPTGSIYHRFTSVDELLASAWLRAADRTQSVHLGVNPDDADPLDVAARLAVAFYDHCVNHPEDVLLLERIGHQDLDAFTLGPDLRARIAQSDAEAAAQVGLMAGALFGADGPAERDAVLLALVDLPQSFARRYLPTGHRPPDRRRAQLPPAVRAVLQA